ncbi:MAG: lipocalin-like domain-containing protein, partial [Bryobacteraceae bacterium]
FGSSAILVRTEAGRDVLLAGQKSGIVYALDPDRKGEIVWQTRVGKGSVVGGVQWGMASDSRRVFAAVSDAGMTRNPGHDPSDTRRFHLDPKQGGGLTALRVADGSRAWYAPPAACGSASGCSPAQSAAVSAIPGVVFSGSFDGHLRAFSAEDGSLIWDFDTVRDFQTVNLVKARGGALDGPGAVVAGGMMFANSGYARFGGMPGNVLLAFAPPQASARDQFIGVWRLASVESRTKNGEVNYPYGEKPVGRITYDRQGRMSAQLMRPGRNVPRGTSTRTAPVEVLREMLNGVASYFGTFDVDEASRTVTHHVQASLNASAVGTDLKRTYEFSGKRLILTAATGDASLRLTWEREPD